MSTTKIERIVTKHAVRLGITDTEAAVKNAVHFARLVGLIENNGKLTGKNPASSATGLYQFIKGSIHPAVNRLARCLGTEQWMLDLLQHRDINQLNWEQQTLLFLGDMLEKRGSDQYMRPILKDGDAVSMMEAYFVLHHTAPDEATKRRAQRIIYGAKE